VDRPQSPPAGRRILDALKQIEDEAPCLMEEAALAATELAKARRK
jgi:hypothetical protein